MRERESKKERRTHKDEGLDVVPCELDICLVIRCHVHEDAKQVLALAPDGLLLLFALIITSSSASNLSRTS
jgi:hypothetical protein